MLVRTGVAFILAAQLSLAGCERTANPPRVTAENAFVIEPLAGRDVTLGGVSLSVQGGPVRLVAATSPQIGAIELHSGQMQGRMMMKAHAHGLDIPANGQLNLRQGGDHFMMFGVAETLKTGDSVDLNLAFMADGRPFELTVTAQVVSLSD